MGLYNSIPWHQFFCARERIRALFLRVLPGKRVKHTMPANSGSGDPVHRDFRGDYSEIANVCKKKGFLKRDRNLIDTAD